MSVRLRLSVYVCLSASVCVCLRLSSKVRLARCIAPTALSMEHISAHVAWDGTTAPKDIRVWGARKGSHGGGRLEYTDIGKDRWTLNNLGEFTYDHSKSTDALQTYALGGAAGAAGTAGTRGGASEKQWGAYKLDVPACFQFVRLEVLTNHGHPSYTCLYRFRVHGDVVPV